MQILNLAYYLTTLSCYHLPTQLTLTWWSYKVNIVLFVVHLEPVDSHKWLNLNSRRCFRSHIICLHLYCQKSRKFYWWLKLYLIRICWRQQVYVLIIISRYLAVLSIYNCMNWPQPHLKQNSARLYANL